jgi:hypothetical protein
MGIVTGADVDWPGSGIHSIWFGRTERVPLSFLKVAGTEGRLVIVWALRPEVDGDGGESMTADEDRRSINTGTTDG